MIPRRASAVKGRQRAECPRSTTGSRRLGLDEPANSGVFLKRAPEPDPKSGPLRRQLAEALYAAGDYAEAEKQFQTLLR